MDGDKPMDNYEGALETNPPPSAEDTVTSSVEDYTASVPSSAYFGLALGAMAVSCACQAAGRGKWGNFIAQWAPTLLIIGLYNKLVKLEGQDRGDNRGYNA